MNDIIIGRNAADREKYGDKGTVFLGKHYIKMGRINSLSNKVYLDVIKSHVIFICGKRGGGKCITGDSLITLSDGSVKRIDSLNSKNEVTSLNESLKMQTNPTSDFYEREVLTTYEMILRTGKKIRLTPEHPLLTINGWVPLEKLGIGSRIAVPRKIPVFGEENISEEKVKILAYLIAKGHTGPNQVLFSNQDKKIIRDFSEAIQNFSKDLRIMSHGQDSYRVSSENKPKQVSLSTRDKTCKFTSGLKWETTDPLIKLLKKLDLWGKNSYEKEIPEQIFRLPKQKLSLFLNRLFSCDGSIYFDYDWRLSYSSTSETLIRQVQHLLARFGVISILRTKKTKSDLGTAYELVIKGEFVKVFLSEIGFFGVKENKQTKALKETITIKRNPDLDTIPQEFWENYSPGNQADLGRHLGYKHSKAMRESKRPSVSRQKLQLIAEYEKNESLMLLADSDIYWDEIIQLKKIEEPIKVYDFTVPKTHNFVANDILVHNSYSLGVIAEGVADLPFEIKQNLSIILVDTMGIYWTMKYPNKADKDILDEWDLEGKGLDVKIFTPSGYHEKYKEAGIPTDYPFSIKPSELSGHDWNTTFNLEDDDPAGVLIEKAIYDLKETGKDYDIKDIILQIEKQKDAENHVKNAAKNRFFNAQKWGLFDKRGTQISDIALPGQVTVLDVSCYATMSGSWNVKNLVVSLIADKLFVHRMTARKEEEYKEVHKSMNPFSDDDIEKQEFPLVWLVLDEAHEFLPRDGKTLATDPLVTILREGRQPGISLILASQQPGKIHTDVMTQSDTVLAHRITAKLDTDALGTLMQSYMRSGLVEELDNLPRENGAAIIFDDSNEKMYPIRIRPRFTWHGGSAPSAIHKKKE